MEGGRRAMINGGSFSQRFSGRPIPKRGQVKLGIVVGLAQSVASIFSLSGRRWQPDRRINFDALKRGIRLEALQCQG